MQSESIREADWKVFRKLSQVALDRFCQRVLSEVTTVVADSEKSAHARYLELYKLIEKEDQKLADLFNDLKRSRAILQFVGMLHNKLLTEEEMSDFSDEFREEVGRWIQPGKFDQ